MDKVAYFKITRLKISRFKSHVEETEYHFGDLTMISGGNHTGKTTIADAIAWVMIGQGFFGGHLLDRFYNDKERKKRIAVELEYVDASGIRHVLSRQRINDKVDAALDGSAIRQKDLNAMFGDADEFLSLVNPLYFVEILAEKGRGLLERNLPPVSQEEVLQRLNGDSQKALEGYSFLSPETALSNLRAEQREIADAMLALDGQSDLLAQQNQECQDRIQALQMEIKALSEQIAGLEAKQKTGIDEGALRLELASLTMRYDEMLNEKPLAFDPAAYRIREMELRTRLSEAERRTFESKFAQEIAVQEKALASMRNRYHQMAAFLTALKPGIICPQCRRPVKEDEILDCEVGLKSALAECKEQGGGIKLKQQELLALETQSRRTFEDWKNSDIAEIQKEVEQLYREEEKAAQKVAQEQADYTAELEKISSRRQTIDVLLSCGNLTSAEEERLSELRKEVTAKAAVQEQLSQESNTPNQNVASQRDILQSQLNDVNARISAVVDYASVRNGLLFKALHTPNVEFQLYDVVKKTGELVPAWKFRYRGTSYQCLSRSEKILAGLEVVELLKRLTGRCYPVFIDDSESIDHIPRPSGQALISKKVADQPLKVQAKNTPMNLPKAG